jgi:hypothetical protein
VLVLPVLLLWDSATPATQSLFGAVAIIFAYPSFVTCRSALCLICALACWSHLQALAYQHQAVQCNHAMPLLLLVLLTISSSVPSLKCCHT